MAEYLPPGVYVEEFDNSPQTMEGVSTSTAGFVGLAAKGPEDGAPQLVTSFVDFCRLYGDYLSVDTYGNYCYLAYAVEYFFINGGTRAYISRVVPQNEGNITADTFIGKDNGPGKRTGIQAFLDNPVCSILAAPGVTDVEVQLALVAHCENLRSRFAVLDMPEDMKKTSELIERRNCFDTSYAALYHPWLSVFSPHERKAIFIPPSGSVAGICARVDNTRGVHRAPANEVVRACTGLSVSYTAAEQDILNPRGINLIRPLAGQGIRVWGARTATSNAAWKYVNVRRLSIYLEESIKASLNWVVFESNDEILWARVKRTIETFLLCQWRGGALTGASPDEAFFIQAGLNTMTQDDIDNGRLILMIGVAAVKPAEFTIFRIMQKTGV